MGSVVTKNIKKSGIYYGNQLNFKRKLDFKSTLICIIIINSNQFTFIRHIVSINSKFLELIKSL